MKKFTILLLVLLIPFYSLAVENLPERPQPARFFNDYSNENLITEQEARSYESFLTHIYDTTQNQITIVIVKTTEPYAIAEYATALGRKWGVGQKDKNTGVVVLWATDDRAVFIATGYGVEGELTDAMSKRIIETVILPKFKEGEYNTGLQQGIHHISNVLSGNFKDDTNVPAKKERKEVNSGDLLIFLFIALVIFLLRMFGVIKPSQQTSRTSFLGGVGRSFGGGSSFGGGRSFGGGSFGGGGAGGKY